MVQRITLLFFALLLAVSPLRVVAQQSQLATAVASPAAAPLAALLVAPDTAAALRRIFAQWRHRGHTGLKVGGAVLGVSAIVAATGTGLQGFQGLGVVAAGALGIVGSVPVLATGVIRTINYSKKREQRLVRAWQQHRLPRHLKRALADDSLLTTQARLAQAAALAAVGPATATPAALDTAAALHRLFAAKRRLVRVMLPLTTAVGAGLALKVATPAPSYGSEVAVLLGATTLLMAAGELAILRRYSKENEALAIQALKEHRLPATQSRELKAEYFRPSKATP